MSNVLVIEPVREVRRGLAALLRVHGHVAVEAADAATALDRVAAGWPDAVLLDLNPTCGDGLAVLWAVANHPDLAGVPVLTFSTDDDPALGRRARQLGAWEHMVKGSDAWTSAVECLEVHVVRARRAWAQAGLRY